MKKNFIMAIIAMLFATTVRVNAQDSYTEVFVEILKVNPQFQTMTTSLDNVKQFLLGLNKKLLKDLSKSEELLNKYAETQMKTDFIVALFIPTIKEHISVSELKDMLKAVSTLEAKNFFSHEAVATKRFEQEFMTIIIESLSSEQALKDLENGKLNIQPVKIETSIPADYIAEFDNFYNKEFTEKFINSYSNVLVATIKDNPTVVESLLTYLKANMRSMCLNVYYGTVTKADMRWSINYQNNPFVKKFSNAILDVMGDLSDKERMKAVFANFAMRYALWIKSQGVEINE